MEAEKPVIEKTIDGIIPVVKDDEYGGSCCTLLTY